MTFERKQAAPALNFEFWKGQLRKDSEREGKLLAFDSLGEYALKLLWENGLDPTVRAIIGSRDGQDELSPAPEEPGQVPQSEPVEAKP